MEGLAIPEIFGEARSVSPDMVQPVGIGACLVGNYLPGTKGLDILRVDSLGYFIGRKHVILR